MSDLPSIALSVRQPWAWAIIHAGKDIENRRPAAVRHGMKPGRIAIHASKGMTRDEYESAAEFMERLGVVCPRPDELMFGAIIGAVMVTAIVKEHPSPWFSGARGLVLADPLPCSPIPAPGSLGYFTWIAGGEMPAPKRWMTHWPEGGRAPTHVSAPPLPLFD